MEPMGKELHIPKNSNQKHIAYGFNIGACIIRTGFGDVPLVSIVVPFWSYLIGS